jgi:ribosomal protein S18 acetylase RimI-like enzyme
VASTEVRRLTKADTTVLPQAFSALGWPGKTAELYERYLTDQAAGDRVVFVAEHAPADPAHDETRAGHQPDRAAARPLDEPPGSAIAGYVTVVWVSGYGPFAEAGIPEIQDLNVLPQFRRRGIASALMDAAEAAIGTWVGTAGIGVGLYADYGAAQLMYLQRGYRPDGRGVAYRGATVAPGSSVPVDDDLALMMTRRLVAPGTAG